MIRIPAATHTAIRHLDSTPRPIRSAPEPEPAPEPDLRTPVMRKHQPPATCVARLDPSSAPSASQSVFNATNGSSLAALRAGTMAANRAVEARTAVAASSTSGSSGATP